MSKIWSLKRWLPLEQAAQFIATLINEHEVSVADLLHLSLELKIKLSVVFPDGVLARICVVVDPQLVPFDDIPALIGNRTVRLYEGGQIFSAPTGDAFQAKGDEGLLPDDAPFDLVMLGGERADVQRWFWSLSGSDVEETSNVDGTFVAHAGVKGPTYFQLLGKFSAADGATTFPLGSIPEGAVYVVRQEEIQRFVSSLLPPPVAKLVSDPSHWPWGQHHTALLGHLDAAARQFWSNYDPSDITTAETNTRVAAWLVGRDVSQRMADSMASILRADGLPTGPRPRDG